MVAGVAGGLGEYTGVDPVLYRVLFGVLTVFGGAGILLYVLGWLFMPEQDQATSPAETLIGRAGSDTGNRGGDAVQAILLTIAALVAGGVFLRGDTGDVVLVVVLVIGGVLLVRHLDDRRDRGTAPSPPPPPPPGGAYQPYQAYAYQPGTGAVATATVPPPVQVQPVEPVRPVAPKERSILGVLTVSVLLVVLGVTGALDAADAAQPQARHYLALALGVLGAGLVVGAFRGRARWLVWIGIPLTVALVGVSTAETSLQGGTGDRQYRPLSVSEIEDHYQIGVGSIRLDLTDLDFSERTVSTKLNAGIGDVEVIVPRDVDVRVVGRAGIGEADLFGQRVNGTSNERTVVDEGPDGGGGGNLELVLEVGIGRVEVDRATS